MRKAAGIAVGNGSTRRFARFLASGAFNTEATYVVYLSLIQWLSYRASYTIAYVLGIGLAYALNRYYVFSAHRGLRSVVLLPFIYGLQYCLGLIILYLWVDIGAFRKEFGPLVVIVFTLPCTYLLSKLAFMKAGPRDPDLDH